MWYHFNMLSVRQSTLFDETRNFSMVSGEWRLLNDDRMRNRHTSMGNYFEPKGVRGAPPSGEVRRRGCYLPSPIFFSNFFFEMTNFGLYFSHWHSIVVYCTETGVSIVFLLYEMFVHSFIIISSESLKRSPSISDVMSRDPNGGALNHNVGGTGFDAWSPWESSNPVSITCGVCYPSYSWKKWGTRSVTVVE